MAIATYVLTFQPIIIYIIILEKSAIYSNTCYDENKKILIKPETEKKKPNTFVEKRFCDSVVGDF